MNELTPEIPVPPPLEQGAPGENGGAEFQPYLALVFALVVIAVAVQNLWLRKRAEAEKREGALGDEG